MLTIHNLSIEFHDRLLPETVVHNLNMHIDQGEIVGIVGESGSGKTMTALAIAGLLNRKDMQKSGSILLDGVDLLTCDRAALRGCQGKVIGMIFQEPMTSLNPVKKIGWQVEEVLLVHENMTKEERYERAIRILEEVELEDPQKIYHSYPHELSGGMRQRVMIAAAMIANPKLLIADEPTTALDVTIQEQMILLLKRINRERKTAILFISHDLSLVEKLCERVIVMKDGYIVEQGKTKDIFQKPEHAYTQKLMKAIPKLEKLHME